MWYLVLAVAVVAADQITKLMTVHNLVPGEAVNVIGTFFRITYLTNDGAAFGMLSGQSRLLTFLPLVVIVPALIFAVSAKKTNPILRCAVALIAAGGIGNIIDRVRLGHVIDMISFSIFPPVFNVADIAVTGGCALIFVYALFGDRIAEWMSERKTKGDRIGS